MERAAPRPTEKGIGMGLLDTIKDRLGLEPRDDYYDDYDEGYDDGFDEHGSGMLGNTSRPEAASISVYTRTGQPLEPEYDEYAPESDVPAQTQSSWTPSPERTQPTRLTDPSQAYGERRVSGQLPAYVLRPSSYDDADAIVRRVRTNQPVVLSFRGTDIEAAKRIFDFCAGFALGIGGAIEELGDRCFVVLPAGVGLSQADIDKLVHDGILSR